MNGAELVSKLAAGLAIISVNLHPVFLASDEAAGSMTFNPEIYVTYSDTYVTNSENLQEVLKHASWRRNRARIQFSWGQAS
jgi:hypothetical protein